MQTIDFSTLRETFSGVVGRNPSQQELEGIMRIKDALSLGYDDPMLSVLMAMENYKSLFIQIPEQIAEAASQVAGVAARSATERVNAHIEQLKAEWEADAHTSHARREESLSHVAEQAMKEFSKQASQPITGPLAVMLSTVVDVTRDRLNTATYDCVQQLNQAASLMAVRLSRSQESPRAWWLKLGLMASVCFVAAFAGAQLVVWSCGLNHVR